MYLKGNIEDSVQDEVHFKNCIPLYIRHYIKTVLQRSKFILYISW